MQTITEKILEILQSGAEEASDFLAAMATDRSTSYRRLRTSLKYGPKHFKTDWASAYRRRKAYYSLLSHLKDEGLVEKENRRNGLWSITKKGREKLLLLKKRQQNAFSLRTAHFEEGDVGMTIFVFDVPEKEKAKRRWLRQSLQSAGFRFLQKSVWIGDSQLSMEFIEALRERLLLPHVHIFKAEKLGTIMNRK